MKSLCLLIVFTWTLTFVHADTIPEDDFLALPGAQSIPPQGSGPDTVLKNIPSALLKELKHSDWGNEDGSVPKTISGFVFDLKQDGTLVYFLLNPVLSGTGGDGYLVFYKFENGWRKIAELQGMLSIYPAKKGTWPLLVSIARGGSGFWNKTYSVFSSLRYEDRACEQYDHGTISWEKFPREN